MGTAFTLPAKALRHAWQKLMPKPKEVTLPPAAISSSHDDTLQKQLDEALYEVVWTTTTKPNPLHIQSLLDAGASPNARDQQNYTPLIVASMRGLSDVVEELLKRNAALDEKNDFGYTALMLAAINDHVDVVQVLLKAGARCDIKDNDNKTALDQLRCRNYEAATDKRIIQWLEEAENNARQSEEARVEKQGKELQAALKAARGNLVLKKPITIRPLKLREHLL